MTNDEAVWCCWRSYELQNSVCADSLLEDPGFSWNRIEDIENRDFTSDTLEDKPGS
jgi:hypothetical protein